MEAHLQRPIEKITRMQIQFNPFLTDTVYEGFSCSPQLQGVRSQSVQCVPRAFGNVADAVNRNSEGLPRRFCLTAVLRGLERSGNPALRGCGEASNRKCGKDQFGA